MKYSLFSRNYNQDLYQKHVSPQSLSACVPVFKNGQCIASTEEEWKDSLQVTHLSYLSFQKPKILRWTMKACTKALSTGAITLQQKWLGAYYHQEIVQQKRPAIEIHWINEQIGFGIFAQQDLPYKTFIGEYTGILRKKHNKHDITNAYIFEYLIGESIDTPYTLDAKDCGNHCRFINHAEDGNCDTMLVFHEGIMRVIIYTNRKVRQAEQLSYDYGIEYWIDRDLPQAML